MKLIKNIILGTFALTGSLAVTSCSGLLDTENLYEANLDSYYSNKTEIDLAMSGVYNSMFVDGVLSEEHLIASLFSDLLLAGGGPDDTNSQNLDAFLSNTEDIHVDLWKETYNGVYCANAVIEAIPNADFTADFTSEDDIEDYMNSSLGEAYFMRAFYMFRAAKIFGGMPLIPTTDADREVARATIPETYQFIATDLLKAIEYLPEENINSISLNDYGHANIWVAKSFLARVYMYYTGYMTNIEKIATDELPYDEGSVTKSDVIAHLEDVINNSGHGLVSDFRNLWPYSYVNESNSIYNPDYVAGDAILPWAADNNLAWVGQDGIHSTLGTGNNEVIFALRFGLGNWDYDGGTGQKYSNRMPLYMGVRDHSMIPFGQGWGWCSVHPTFYNGWSDTDTRKAGSVLTLGDADQGTGSWVAGKSNQETTLMNKKYTTLQHNGDDGVLGMFYYIYNMNNADPMQLWAAQDFYYMRYADVLLMHSELTETADGLNKVRERAGLEATAYSLEAIKTERMYEFAFEGVRWFDLVRWGDVETSNNYYSSPITVSNAGVEASYSVTYRAETKGLSAIPQSEIRLSNGIYSQNPGW
ncbi:MAG: RagB/SusD family nutrient uptake outer membrane protein [Rikenellaceae bacterium]